MVIEYRPAVLHRLQRHSSDTFCTSYPISVFFLSGKRSDAQRTSTQIDNSFTVFFLKKDPFYFSWVLKKKKKKITSYI